MRAAAVRELKSERFAYTVAGLAATMYGPNVVRARVGVGAGRAAVEITVNTAYPSEARLSTIVTPIIRPSGRLLRQRWHIYIHANLAGRRPPLSRFSDRGTADG